MPIVRYQIRNEYGLADPELYGAADKEDPEALLEGVAMAGLVGVLRQLGDLAEFAAEIFHNLHEEVMATAARGHALMLRVQQLEVDVPAIERGFLSPTHRSLFDNAGIDWHPNLQIDQNLITQEDMPRFVLDSYEESRGPPRLFMLDKFDIAGDGACLKRYSDPSFFKMDFAASGKMEPDIQREKRSRKNKKKVPRLRNGETPESYFTPHVNPKLEHLASEKAPENPPAVKRVKLKTRQLNDNTTIRRSYMEHIVGSQSAEHTDLSENSMGQSQVKMKTIDSTELAPDVREVIMDTSIVRPFFRDRNRTRHYNKEELSLTQKDETVSDIRDIQNEKKGSFQKTTGEVERLPPNFNKTDRKSFFDTDHKRDGNGDAESRTNGSLDSYRSDDAASELDNYLDALTTMDSEIETDNEIKAKPTPSFFSKEYNKMDSSVNEERAAMDSEVETDNEMKAKSTPNFFSNEYNKMDSNVNEERAAVDSEIETDNETKAKPAPSFFSKEYNMMYSNIHEEKQLLGEHLSSHVIRESSAQISLSNERMSSPPKEDSLKCLADLEPSHGTSRALPGLIIDPEAPAGETHKIDFENKANIELLEKDSSIDLVPKQMISDIPMPFSEFGVASTSSSNTDTTAAQICTDLHAISEDVQSVITTENTSVKTNSTEKSSVCFDGEYSPPVNSDALGAAEDMNVTFCNPTEGHGDVDKLLEDDFHKKSDESKIPSITKDDDVNPVLISQDTETLSDASLQLGDGSDLHLPIDNLSFQTQIAVPCTEEPSAHGIMSIPSVSDPPQVLEAANLEITSSTCIEDPPPPLSMSSEEELHGSACQGFEVDSGQSTLQGNSLPIPSLDYSSGIFVPDSIFGSIGNSVLMDEKFDCATSLTIPEDVADFAEDKGTSPENTGNFTENEVMASGILLPGHPFDMEVPQESCNLEQVEFTEKGELPNILKVLPNASDYDTRDSFLVNETRDSPFPSGELPAESCSPHLVTECSEADELYSSTMHLKESSSNETIQEEDVSSDLASERKKLEVTEAFFQKDLIDLDVQQVPGTIASQEEYIMVTDPQDSVPAGYVLDSSSQPDCGEPNHVCHTGPFELAQDDLYPTDDNKTPISFAEVEGGRLLSPVSQNGPKTIESGGEHYLDNIEVSNSEDLTGEDAHQVSKIDFPGQEESDAFGIPGDSKSAEPVHDSYDNMDMKPVISVPCQEDQKMVVPLQTSRTEERLLDSSVISDIESVKHAEVSMHPLEVNEVIEFPSENESPHSKSLASCEPCQAANGDVLPSEDVITEDISPSREVINTQFSDESIEISLLENFGRLDLSDIQFQRGQSQGQDDNFMKTGSQPSEPEAAQNAVNPVNSDEMYELGISSANVSHLNQLEMQPASSLQASLGIPVSSAISSASLASLQNFSSLGASSTVMIQQQPSELPLDSPPLPPLPPLQWRMGKLRPSSIMTNGEMTRPQSGVNSLTTLPYLDRSGGPQVMGGAMVQLANPFLQVPIHPSDQFGYQTIEEERMNPFHSSALPPAVEDKKCQDDMLALDTQMKDLPANSSSVVSNVEGDQQKNEFCQEASSGEVPQLLNSLTSPLELSDVRSQQFHAVSDGESTEPPKSSAPQPTLVYIESLHENVSLETVTMHPSNPFLSSASTEGEHDQYDYGTFGDRTVQHLTAPDTLSMSEIAPQGLLISQEANMQTFESLTLPAAGTENPNGRPCSLLNRPRDPLIEAVAAHDKSTLRRVSEMVLPSAKPESERNTLLEQIRNKSFSLKPATVAKPNIKGPPTNLKVAAILERANAIRQAFVGSDEDDDGDSWSDS